MTGAASRTRGANAERAVAAYLRDNGFPNAKRTFAGDGRQDSDIAGVPGVSIEVKDVASSAWPSWRAQAVEQALPGDIVVVVRRWRGVSDVGRWEAQMPLRDWHWLVYMSGIVPLFTVHCKRTKEQWVRCVFSDIVALLAVDS